jgi:superoxide dismutase, Cu-Zn family
MSRCKIVWMIPLAALLLALPACRREQTEAPDATAETTASPEGTVPPLGAPANSTGPSARATLQAGPEDTDFTGTFTQQGDGLLVVADLAGVDTPGEHGFHVHATGECTHDAAGGKHFTSAGGHFNPNNVEHACPPNEPRHAGDLGNVQIGANGAGRSEQTTNLLSLSGPNSVVGKAIILHAGADDCQTQPTGNSGDRLACGVVTMEDATPQ